MWNRPGCRCGDKIIWVRCCVAFGIGLALSCFCPVCLIMFILAVILIWLGVALLKKC